MQLKSVLAAASSIAALAFAAPALAACEDLAGMAVPNGRVTAAAVVDAGGFVAPPSPFGPPPGVAASPFADVPAFCRVQLTLTPTPDSDIRSEVWLPLTGWNGKYVGVGNGIWAGSLSYTEMGRNVVRRYATAATDTGHVGNGLTAEWAIGHPEKLVDFGHRAVHVTTVAAKAVVTRFYGRAPERSYWNSCSTGGRQGLMAAYRYPGDFDAISAMAPANPMTDLMTQSMWQGWQPHRFGVQITPQVLGAVHAEVIRQCDALDGLTDGLVGNPLQCRFDLARVDPVSYTHL
ncbi:MAG: tannase/feruloyl esterase family alpha/beta hydrolase, partial [Alteraurantiacibacter sp.]|nr:tannase/feruloyl esterase family alpha/beta hydrolase [Alteraurantiacibacter sp.]